MSEGLSWSDACHAGARGAIAVGLLVPCGVWAAGSYDVAASGYAFASMHFQGGAQGLLLPLVTCLGLIATPAGLVERRFGRRESARQHATLLALTALVTGVGLLVAVVQASYLAALWQLGLVAGWEAAAVRLGELTRLMRAFPVDTTILVATFTAPYVIVAMLRSHQAWALRLLLGAAGFSALLAGLMYSSIAPETQRLAWLSADAETIGKTRLILTWSGLIGGLAFVLAASALLADRAVGVDREPDAIPQP